MSPGKKLKVSVFACPQRATSISLKFLSKSKFGVIQNTCTFLVSQPFTPTKKPQFEKNFTF